MELAFYSGYFQKFKSTFRKSNLGISKHAFTANVTECRFDS